MKSEIVWPKMLMQAILSNRLAIFFGAGIGVEFGFKSWEALVEELYNRIEIDDTQTSDEITNAIKYRDFLTALDILKTSNQSDFESILSSENSNFNGEDISNSNEKLLFDLGAEIYLTTNIDSSLEYVKAHIGKASLPIWNYKTDAVEIRDALITRGVEENPLVIRLHGDLNNKESLIFTSTDYAQLRLKNNYVFETLLPAILTTYTILFVGYSLDDPDIKMLLENVSKVQGRNLNLIALFDDGDKEVITVHKENYFKANFGVDIIRMNKLGNENKTEQLKRYLTDLLFIKRKMDPVQNDEFVVKEAVQSFREDKSTKVYIQKLRGNKE